MSTRDVLFPFGDVLTAVPEFEQLFRAQDVLDLGWLGEAWCQQLDVRAGEPDGHELLARVVLQTDAVLTIADLGLVEVAVAGEDGAIEAAVRVRTGARGGFVAELPLRVRIRQPLLRRVDPATGATLDEALEMRATAFVGVDTRGPAVTLHNLSIPPCMLGRTGVVLAFDDVTLSGITDDAPTALTAGTAVLRWLPQFVPALADVPGFTVALTDVVVDEDGVSFELDRTWAVHRNAGGGISPRSAAFGDVLGLRVALAGLHADVVGSTPVALGVDGHIEVPWLPGAADVRFGWRETPEGLGTVDVAVRHPGRTVAIGHGRIELAQLELSGTLDDDHVDLAGSVQATVTLPGWTTGPVRADVRVTQAALRWKLALEFRDVGIGPLGQVDVAELHVELVPVAEGAWDAASVVLGAELIWSDLAERIAADDWPSGTPRPPDDARVRGEVTWDDPRVELALLVAGDDTADVWRFLPAAWRPMTRRVELALSASFAGGAEFAAAGTSPPAVDIGFLVEFRPVFPSVPGDLLRFTTGGDDGFVTARARVVVDPAGPDRIELSIADIATADLSVPFVGSGRSVAHAVLDEVRMTLVAADGGTQDRLSLSATGDVTLRDPRLAGRDPLTQAVSAFLAPLGADGVAGTVTMTLDTDGTDAGTSFSLIGTLADTQLDVDVLALLATMAPTQHAGGSSAEFRGEFPLDTDVRFTLDGLALRVTPPVDGRPRTAALDCSVTAEIGGVAVAAVVGLSTEELGLGLTAEIPLRLPRFPVGPSDLAVLAGRSGTGWTETGFDAALQEVERGLVELGPPGAGSEAQRRAYRRQTGELRARGAALAYLSRLWGPLSDDARGRFESATEPLIGILAAAVALTHLESDVRLHVQARVRIPWQRPQDVALEGGGALHGFAPDDPFHGLEGMELSLGLSPDQIYFSAEGSGDPLPLPDLGRYPGGAVSLSRLSVGYGFTRNSLAMSFAGTLTLPSQLVADADLSTQVGFGVRLPQHTSLAFRLDVIPVPGPIPVVPAGEFALDLRTPGRPGIAATAECVPVWDGLALEIPGLVHVDLKQVAASPLFGVLPAPNLRLDGDIDLGTRENGLTLICDDLLWFPPTGITTAVTMPLLFDPMAPFFEHLCLNVRFLGLGLNIDLQRPFPQPSPMVLLDALAFVADPTRPLDPDGPLANLIRVAVTDAALILPDWLSRMVPGARDALRHPVSAEIDLGTLISGVQWIVAAAGTALDVAAAALDAGGAALQEAGATPGEFDVGPLVELLPQELRVVPAAFDLAGVRGQGAIALFSVASGTMPTIAPFDRFTIADLNELPPLPDGADGVVVATELVVLDGTMLTCVGHVADTGHVALVSTVATRVGVLRVAGLDVPVPLTFRGRATLTGQINRRRAEATVILRGDGSWEPIPGVVALRLGRAQQPVEVELSTTGRFRLEGTGAASLFGDVATVRGSVSVSNAHAAVSGDLSFAFSRAGSAVPWLTVAASGSMAIGPGTRFLFEGAGELQVLGNRVATAGVRLTESELALTADLDTGAFPLGPTTIAVDAAVAGRVTVGPSGPDTLTLRGDGRITAGPLSLTGRVGVTVGPSGTSFTAAGSMRWMGRSWLGAEAELDGDGTIRLRGSTAVAVSLLRSDLPGGIELSSLFLRIGISGRVELSPRSGLGQYALDIDWSVGVRMPGVRGQILVLAMQRQQAEGTGSLDVELLDVDGLWFVPGGNLEIPVPTLTVDDFEDVNLVRIDVPVLDQLAFLATDDMVDFIEGVVPDEELVRSERLFQFPTTFRAGFETVTLDDLSRALSFRLSLVWRGRGLALLIERDGSDEQLVRFADLA